MRAEDGWFFLHGRVFIPNKEAPRRTCETWVDSAFQDDHRPYLSIYLRERFSGLGGSVGSRQTKGMCETGGCLSQLIKSDSMGTVLRHVIQASKKFGMNLRRSIFSFSTVNLAITADTKL